MYVTLGGGGKETKDLIECHGKLRLLTAEYGKATAV